MRIPNTWDYSALYSLSTSLKSKRVLLCSCIPIPSSVVKNFNGIRMRLCNIEFDESQKMTKRICWKLNEPNRLEFNKEIGKYLKKKKVQNMHKPLLKKLHERNQPTLWKGWFESRSRTSLFHTQMMMYSQCWLTLPGHVSTQYPQKPSQWIHWKSFSLCNKSSLEVVLEMGSKFIISTKRHWWVGNMARQNLVFLKSRRNLSPRQGFILINNEYLNKSLKIMINHLILLCQCTQLQNG